jgi:uncharacterized glyoxalase superfamily protein PhnB
MPKKKPSRKPARAKRPAAKASRKVSPIPAGLSSLTPNLVLRDCARAIEFYKEAFGAKELNRAIAPDGKSVWHCALKIGNAQLFLNDPMMNEPAKEPSGQLWIYGPDVDARWDRAIKAGGKAIMPVADQFWGDRMGVLVDPFGQAWTLATHLKDLSQQQMIKAGQEFAAKMAEQAGGQPPPGNPTQPQANA